MRKSTILPNIPSQDPEVFTTVRTSACAIVVAEARTTVEDVVGFMVFAKAAEPWMTEEMVSEREMIECWTLSAELIAIVTIQSLNCSKIISGVLKSVDLKRKKVVLPNAHA